MMVQRMCAICREVKTKDELVRIVKQKQKVSIDLSGKAAGRGAYICKSAECVRLARKKRALERSFSAAVDGLVYDELEAMYVGEQ